jgi:hypothetical protein
MQHTSDPGWLFKNLDCSAKKLVVLFSKIIMVLGRR